MDRFMRLGWFWLKLLSALAAGIGLMCFAFFATMDTVNLWVMTSEAMDLQARVVLQEGDNADLLACFTQRYIDTSPTVLITAKDYASYTISNYEVRTSVQSVSCWPWRGSATAIVTQRITNLDGTVHADALQANPNMEKAPPKWPSLKYRVHFRRMPDGWKIDQMTALEAVPDRWQPPWLTPAPSGTMAASPTPVPAATDEPAP